MSSTPGGDDMNRYKMTIRITVNQYIYPERHKLGSWVKYDDHTKEIEQLKKEKEWLIQDYARLIHKNYPDTKLDFQLYQIRKALDEATGGQSEKEAREKAKGKPSVKKRTGFLEGQNP